MATANATCQEPDTCLAHVHVSRTSSARLMARAFARLAALGLLVLAAADETPWEDEGVTVLNSVNFDHFINTHRLVMVKFYAPW